MRVGTADEAGRGEDARETPLGAGGGKRGRLLRERKVSATALLIARGTNPIVCMNVLATVLSSAAGLEALERVASLPPNGIAS